MIDPWELLLHHSYTGVPGVIFDQSPGRNNHGIAFNLATSDFLEDGASAGSGAVRFHPGSAVHVSAAKPWGPLDAVRVEIVCRRDDGGSGTLIEGSNSFTFGLGDQGAPGGSWKLTDGTMSLWGTVDGGPGTVFSNKWVTIAFVYGGPGLSGLWLDGVEVSEGFPDNAPIVPAHQVAIGNGVNGNSAFGGIIDDIKVWRLNPHWADGTFTGRPIDPGLPNCWGGWSKSLGGALGSDLECADRVRQLVNAAVNGIIQRAAANAATNAIWQDAIADYRQRWPAGDFDGIATTMGGVLSQIGDELQLTTDPAIAALATDPCVKRILDQLPSLDCDEQFFDLLRKITSQL